MKASHDSRRKRITDKLIGRKPIRTHVRKARVRNSNEAARPTSSPAPPPSWIQVGGRRGAIKLFHSTLGRSRYRIKTIACETVNG